MRMRKRTTSTSGGRSYSIPICFRRRTHFLRSDRVVRSRFQNNTANSWSVNATQRPIEHESVRVSRCSCQSRKSHTSRCTHLTRTIPNRRTKGKYPQPRTTTEQVRTVFFFDEVGRNQTKEIQRYGLSISNDQVNNRSESRARAGFSLEQQQHI